jgi:cytochrome b561
VIPPARITLSRSIKEAQMSRPSQDVVPLEFDPVIKFLHWFTLLLVVTVFVLAFSIDHVPRGAKESVLQLHRSIGLTIWAVTSGRLVWRQFTRFPNWPDDMTQAMRVATNASEYVLYMVLLIQPVLGVIQTNARGDKVNLFFLGDLPALIGPDRLFERQVHAVHEMVGYILLGMIGLHAASGLYHHFWRRDRTLRAMLPGGVTITSNQAERRAVG